MTEGDAAAEFDEEDHPASGPLLPPEDRLWRHPSEVATQGVATKLDPAVIRSRWLAREPTRATAWTAGLVGALLATGIVLVGTHLATFLTRPPLVEQTDSSSVVPTSATGTTVPSATMRGYGLGTSFYDAVTRLGGATVAVHAFRGSVEVASLGLVLESDGTIVTAEAAVRNATSILVDPAHGGSELVATVSGVDRRTGLAILHVNHMLSTPVATLDNPSKMKKAAFVLAVTSPGGATYAPAALTSVDITPKVGGVAMVDASATDLGSAYAPLGSPVLDSDGRLIGIVVGTLGGKAVLTPAWILRPVADELDDLGSVTQGWMGINGTTVKSASGASTGVHVVAVAPRSAAANAGIEAGDTITSIDGLAVTSISALQGHLYTERPGTIVSVGVIDHAKSETVDVTLAGIHS